MGGGLYAAAGSATLADSTMFGNRASGGQRFTNCCRVEPAGNGIGGGVEVVGPTAIINTTIAGNATTRGKERGGGIDVAGSATLTNTIVAADSAVNGPDCSGMVDSGGHNLLGNSASCSGFTGSGDLQDVDLLLGPLQDNGGPTLTMVLQPESPAIDAGDDSVCGAPPVRGLDQRGVKRPQGPHCDIGAFEVQ